MKQTFKVLNVKCGGCAHTLKSKLKDKFGEVEVDLEKEPREITLEINEEKISELSEALKKLGYPMENDALDFVESTTAKAKSFVSCAVGKLSEKK